MIIVGSRYQNSKARDLRVLARDKISQRSEITDDQGFREKLREDHEGVIEFIKFLI